MQFFDVPAQFKALENGISNSLKLVFERGDFIQGEEVKILENTFENKLETKCVTVGNGTDALYIALKALGIGPGDEVITPSFTWVSTVEAIKLSGAEPIYCDINYDTFNIDENLIAEKITSSTKAVMTVSLYGQCPNLKEIKNLTEKKDIFLIEDAAQSFGAEHFGNLSCSIADISTTSFFPTKPLSCFGDGGAIFSKDEELIQKANILSKNGQSGRYNYLDVGVNSRLDTIQAAIILEKLKIFDSENKRKQEIASKYDSILSDIDGITVPKILKQNKSVYALYTLKISSKQRDKVKEYLLANNIPCGIYYPLGLHQTKPYLDDISLPVTDNVCSQVLSIPMHPYLKDEDIEHITDTFKNFFQ